MRRHARKPNWHRGMLLSITYLKYVIFLAFPSKHAYANIVSRII
jgi:hypothetical protein